MKKKRLFIIMAAALVVIIAISVIITLLNTNETPSITLPSPSGTTSAPPSNSSKPNEASPENVVSLIEMLEKPDSYSRGYTVVRFWNGGQAEESITFYQKNDQYRLISSGNGRVKNTLIRDNKISYWYDDSAIVREVSYTGDFLNYLYEYAGLIDYSELLTLPVSRILEAGNENVYSENCIFVKYDRGDGYVCTLYISVDTALLIAAKVENNGELVYSLVPEFAELVPPADSLFELP
jgi:hypothetical protein